MTEIKPKYFDHPDLCIRYLEWAAIKKLVFNGDGRKHHSYFEDTGRGWALWADYYTDNHKTRHTEIMTSAHDGTYKNIDEFYVAIDALLKPKPKGKALKDKKKRTAQKAYQEDVRVMHLLKTMLLSLLLKPVLVTYQKPLQMLVQ